jgi:predicted DNA-binding protein
MAISSAPTSIRLSPAEKRRIVAAARQRGLSPSTYIKRAALAGPPQASDAKLARLEDLVANLLETIEDERDYRIASSRWESHLKNKTKLYTGTEVWRELGL